MKFKCHCEFHVIDVDTTPIHGKDYIGMTIYNHKSEQTGNEFKHPKEMGTIVLIGEEARKFKQFINTWEVK